MSTPLEVTKQEFYTDSFNLYNASDDLVLEDCRFILFTELLDDSDVFKNPRICRKRRFVGNSYWSLIGYSYNSYIYSDEDEDEDREGEGDEGSEDEDQREIHYQYTIFNGFFSDDSDVENALMSDLDRAIRETTRFLENTFGGDHLEDIHEVRELQKHLQNCQSNNTLDRIDICILTDKIIRQEKLPTKHKIAGTDIECRIYYWDFKKWNDLKRSNEQRIPIDVDFNSDEYSSYQVKYAMQRRNEVSSFLAFFPGDLIADLYDYYNTGLLENNVRVFLSANRRANKAIRETIAIKPKLFFSYNNGLSATAASVKVGEDFIEKIEDFQIVNGGQTTASIHYARKKDKKSLSDVYVPVKITSLRQDENYPEIVSEIAKAANTQTAIKSSDFYANDPLLVKIEQLASRNPIEDENQTFIYYFFERMSGQYNVSKNSQGTKSNIRAWEKSHPKALLFNKIDVARSYNCTMLKPHVAASSAEKQFVSFIKNHDLRNIGINEYKDLIGFGLLFKRARKLCGTKNGVQYPSIIGDSSVAMAATIYTMSYLHFISEGKLNYHLAYNNTRLIKSLVSKDRINTEFDYVLENIIKSTWKKMAVFGGTSVQEQSKQSKCWDFVKKNTHLDSVTIGKIEDFKLTERDIQQRNREDINDEYFYFNNLGELLSDNGKLLNSLYQISQTNIEYHVERNILRNIKRRIQNRTSVITLSRIKDVVEFYDRLVNDGIDLNQNHIPENWELDTPDFSKIYNTIFKDRSDSLRRIDERTLELVEEKGDEVLNMENQLKALIEEFDNYPGLSIAQLKDLEQLMEYFEI
ncbi:AIPR family protein [Bacteroidota bacterium]